MAKIVTFRDLIVWQKAHRFVLAVYQETKKFPPSEQYGLSSQMRRAAISITSNIAEGFGRGSAKDKTNFYLIAKGSLFEIQSQVYVAKDLGYLNGDTFPDSLMDEIGRLLSGLIKSATNRNV